MKNALPTFVLALAALLAAHPAAGQVPDQLKYSIPALPAYAQSGAQLGFSVAIDGSYIVVGDAQGYLHWLDKRDGHFAAREYLGAAIFAKPLVDNRVLYVLANNGTLAAYQLGS